MFEYMILVDESCTALSCAVRVYLVEGWRPLGGLAVGYREGYIKQEPTLHGAGPRAWALPADPKRKMYWAQAMTREGETK